MTDRLKLGVKVVVVMVVTNNTELLSHDRVDGVVLEGGRLSLVVVVVILLMTMVNGDHSVAIGGDAVHHQAVTFLAADGHGQV